MGNWVGEFDSDQAQRVLSGEDPFDEATMIDDEEPPELTEHPLPGDTAQPVKLGTTSV
jgi:aerobic C4-dicarboxylate transport protein